MRMSRKEYWIKYIASMIAMTVAIILTIGAIYMFSDGALLLIPIVLIIFLGLGIVQIVWMVKRLHDVGLSGVWILLGFVPAVGNIAVLIMTLLPSDTFDMWVE